MNIQGKTFLISGGASGWVPRPHALSNFVRTLEINLVGTFNMIRLDGAIRMAAK